MKRLSTTPREQQAEAAKLDGASADNLKEIGYGSDDLGPTTIGALLARDGGSIKTGPFGTILKAKEYSKEGVPLISVGEVGYGSLRIHDSTPRAPREVVERLPEYLLQSGDIVFGRKGAIDRSAMVKPEEAGWFLGSDGIRLRLPNTCDARFIAYQLLNYEVRSWLLQHATGTTMASLNQSTIERLPIALPSLIEQRAIAHILGTLDDKIELNRRMNETLEAMARALFNSWFVDFDPVRAKAEGRDSGLPKPVADLFPDSFEDSEWGQIPKGWRYRHLGDLVELTRGRTYKSYLKELPGPVLLGLASIRRNGGFRDDKLSTYGGDSPASLVLGPGDLFVSLKDVTQAGDLLGAVARVPSHVARGRLTQDTVKLTFRSAATSHQLTYRTLLAAEYREYCRSHATGTTNLGLSRKDFLAFPVLQPSHAARRAFDSAINSMEARASAAAAESRSLAALRDALLPKLISGEKRVTATIPVVPYA